jgi:hypothetical protein
MRPSTVARQLREHGRRAGAAADGGRGGAGGGRQRGRVRAMPRRAGHQRPQGGAPALRHGVRSLPPCACMNGLHHA